MPKGVIVSPDLFRALDAEKALDRKLAMPWGLPGRRPLSSSTPKKSKNHRTNVPARLSLKDAFK